MSAATLPPPRPPVCLTRSSLSRGNKGGTVIAEDVLDLERHEQLLSDPDAYRPKDCRHCGGRRLHAHCLRTRCLRGGPTVTIRLYRCAASSCRAVFTVLPAFVARHLWRSWPSVQETVRSECGVPQSTLRRWLGRIASDATQLFQVFTANLSGAVAGALLNARPTTRSALVETLCPFFDPALSSFALTATWIHRLAPGVRLM